MTLKEALYIYEYGLNINCIVTSQSLLTTTKFLVVADGEAPPVQDEVECSTCKRSFAPKVLVKSATSHSVTVHIKYETVWLTFVVWSLKVLQLQAQFDLTFSDSCTKKNRYFHCVKQTLRCAEVAAKKYFFDSLHQLTWYQQFGCVIGFSTNCWEAPVKSSFRGVFKKQANH